MDVRDPDDDRVVAGIATKTGITAPGYPERAVYELCVWRQTLPGLYVYEDGQFVPIDEWYATTKEALAG